MTPCPWCGGRMLAGRVDGRDAIACISCGNTPGAQPPAPTRRGTVLDRLNAQQEADVVTAIERAIHARGGMSLRVGQRNARGAGTTRGCPDLFVWVPGMPDATWFGIEVKRPGGRHRPAQRDLADAGRIVIVDSVQSALDALEEVGVG